MLMFDEIINVLADKKMPTTKLMKYWKKYVTSSTLTNMNVSKSINIVLLNNSILLSPNYIN